VGGGGGGEGRGGYLFGYVVNNSVCRAKALFIPTAGSAECCAELKGKRGGGFKGEGEGV